MTILSDRELAALNPGFITPMVMRQTGRAQGKISYGLSSYGYDARLDRKFKVFSNLHGPVIDPKRFPENATVDLDTDECIIQPNSYALGRTMERFKMPRDVVAICVGKSTYARCGIIVNVTPLEPGWEGHVTLEIGNATPCPVKVYAGEGICQFLFFKGVGPLTTYAERNGKYQGQEGVTTARV